MMSNLAELGEKIIANFYTVEGPQDMMVQRGMFLYSNRVIG